MVSLPIEYSVSKFQRLSKTNRIKLNYGRTTQSGHSIRSKMCVKRARELFITESLASKKEGFMTMIGLLARKRQEKARRMIISQCHHHEPDQTTTDDCRRRDQILANNID